MWVCVRVCMHVWSMWMVGLCHAYVCVYVRVRNEQNRTKQYDRIVCRFFFEIVQKPLQQKNKRKERRKKKEEEKNGWRWEILQPLV